MRAGETTLLVKFGSHRGAFTGSNAATFLFPNSNKSTRTRKTKVRASNDAILARNAPQLLIAGTSTYNVLPRRWRGNLRYAETFSLSTGAAGILGTSQVMRLNSVYDPNSTGTGHQPYGYDQLSAFYQSYIVHACRYRLICSTIGGTPEVAVAFQVLPTGTNLLTGTSVDAATEKSMAVVFPVGPSGNARTREVSGAVQLYKVMGVTPQQYLNDLSQFAALISANPSTTLYLEVCIGSYSGTAGETLAVQIVLDYDVEFFQPVTMAQS